MSSADWLAAWDGYQLKAISPSVLKRILGFDSAKEMLVSSSLGTNLGLTTSMTFDTIASMIAANSDINDCLNKMRSMCADLGVGNVTNKVLGSPTTENYQIWKNYSKIYTELSKYSSVKPHFVIFVTSGSTINADNIGIAPRYVDQAICHISDPSGIWGGVPVSSEVKQLFSTGHPVSISKTNHGFSCAYIGAPKGIYYIGVAVTIKNSQLASESNSYTIRVLVFKLY